MFISSLGCSQHNTESQLRVRMQLDDTERRQKVISLQVASHILLISLSAGSSAAVLATVRLRGREYFNWSPQLHPYAIFSVQPLRYVKITIVVVPERSYTVEVCKQH